MVRCGAASAAEELGGQEPLSGRRDWALRKKGLSSSISRSPFGLSNTSDKRIKAPPFPPSTVMSGPEGGGNNHGDFLPARADDGWQLRTTALRSQSSSPIPATENIRYSLVAFTANGVDRKRRRRHKRSWGGRIRDGVEIREALTFLKMDQEMGRVELTFIRWKW